MARLVRSVVLVACLSIASSANAFPPPNYLMMWEQFKDQYGKAYNGVDEEQTRFGIFKANVDVIYDVNSKGLSYTFGVNQFTDLTVEEFAATYTGLKKPKDLWGDLPHLGRHSYSGKALADSVDWTTKGAVTPVKNQGQCGSCWAFSTTGALEGANQIVTGRLVSISEQQFVDCAKNGDSGCGGGNIEAAFRWAEGSAICTEDSYPYEAKDGSCRASGCSAAIGHGKVVGYKQVAKQPHVIDASEKDLMSAVAQQPVSIAIDAGGIMSYKSGVFSGNCGQSINHGVLLVGYGVDPTGGDYWKVKNSWGPTWGSSGYLLIKRGDPEKGGKCGILQDPSYPILSGSSSVVV